MQTRLMLGALVCGVMLMAGCATSSITAGADPVLARPEASAPREAVGVSVQGRPIEVMTLGAGRETVLIIATIHGDEAAGTPLLERLVGELAQNPRLLDGRRVVLAPCVNPDGMAANTRGNVNGVDLNRNFPASNFREQASNGESPLSEPESRAIESMLRRFNPVRVVSIHQPLRCVDYDGPPGTESLAEAMASAGPLSVRKLGTRPGSMGAYVGEELGIPIITLELPDAASRQGAARLWEQYGPMLLAAIAFDEA